MFVVVLLCEIVLYYVLFIFLLYFVSGSSFCPLVSEWLTSLTSDHKHNTTYIGSIPATYVKDKIPDTYPWLGVSLVVLS